MAMSTYAFQATMVSCLQCHDPKHSHLRAFQVEFPNGSQTKFLIWSSKESFAFRASMIKTPPTSHNSFSLTQFDLKAPSI